MSVDSFQTEFEFELPLGYIDDSGMCHKQGRMRLATAADEILPLKDPRVQSNPAYLTVIVLSRVIVQLGSSEMINTRVVESLFSADFAFLQDMYNRINQDGSNHIPAECPKCNHAFRVEARTLGEG